MALLLRKPLLLALVLGCFVSAAASGRFSARLVFDGAVSFAFLPAIEIAALALVTARRGRRLSPFARTVDRFLAGNHPWLLWLIGVTIIAVGVPPRQVGAWLPWAAASGLAPFVWSVRLDLQFFRESRGDAGREAMTDLLLNRAIGWPLGIAYFFGIAIWSDQLPEFLRWIGL